MPSRFHSERAAGEPGRATGVQAIEARTGREESQMNRRTLRSSVASESWVSEYLNSCMQAKAPHFCGASSGNDGELAHRSTLRRLAEIEFRQRQLSYALTRSCKNRVAECRHKRRHTRLAHSGWRSVGLHQVNIGLIRRLVDAGHRVVIKVRLLDRAILHGNLAMAGDAGSEYRRAFELRFGAIRIDHRPRVNHVIHTRNGDVAIAVDLYFDHASDVRQKTAVRGKPVAHTLARLLLAPAGLLRHQFDDVSQASGIHWIFLRRSAVVRVFHAQRFEIDLARRTNEIESVLDVVSPRVCRQLGSKSLHRERLVDVGHRAQPANAHVRRGWSIFHA